MDFLGIGPLELIFVFIIILIVLGPNDMVKAGATLGRYIRQIMKSDTWRVIQETSREIRGLPTKLARQAGLEEFEKELREGMDFPKIGDIPKKIEEELQKDLQFDSWTNPASEMPSLKETEPRTTTSAQSTPSKDNPEEIDSKPADENQVLNEPSAAATPPDEPGEPAAE